MNSKKIEWVLDWLFPGRCPVCDDVVPLPGEKICPDCRDRLLYAFEPVCRRCGRPVRSVEKEFCSDCSTKNHLYKEGAALFQYDSVMKHSIYRFKYQGRKEYGSFYGDQIAEYLGDRIRSWKPDLLLPVPLHPTKQNKRGYNQATVLAEAMGKRLGIPVADGLVRRVKNTTPQKELDEAGRQNNLKKAFIICQNDVKLKTIIIVDDIYTTGSTVDAVAKELISAGAQAVYYISLAIGER